MTRHVLPTILTRWSARGAVDAIEFAEWERMAIAGELRAMPVGGITSRPAPSMPGRRPFPPSRSDAAQPRAGHPRPDGPNRARSDAPALPKKD